MSDVDDAAELRGAASNIVDAFRRASRQALRPGLHLVATPIGNLADITLRALSVLERAAVIYCEDTRQTRKLLAHYGIATRTRSYHEHNAEEERPRILAALREGLVVALVSDAGTPLISDPGYRLVRDALAEGLHVESLPGACAPIVALTSSGLPTDSFFFAGFLPSKCGARLARIGELKGAPGSVIFFEAPSRLAETLGDLAEALGPRRAAVARELTKLHEEMIAGTLPDLAVQVASMDVRGEIVIVVGPPASDNPMTDDDLSRELAAALDVMTLRDAAKAVADKHGVPKSRVYDLGLALMRSKS